MEIKIPYIPREHDIHARLERARYAVIVAHRRYGKTVLSICHLIQSALSCTLERGSFAYIAPQRNQAKLIAWDYLKYYCKHFNFIKINESELSIHFIPNGATIRVFGADNPDSLRGLYFDLVVMDEVAQMKPAVWHEVVRPALADRHGKAIFIGTPKGVNLFSELYSKACIEQSNGNRDYLALSYPVTATTVLKPEEVDALKIELSENAFRQEMLCDFQAASDDVLIPLALVEEAMNRSYQEWQFENSPMVFGIDIARFGDDSSVLFKKQGIITHKPIIYTKLDNMELADRIAGEIQKDKPMAVFIDAGGGAGVIDRLRQLQFDIIEVPFGSKAVDGSRYYNRRAEMWCEMKEWIKTGGAIYPDEALKAELSTPTYFFNGDGRIQLEQKDKIKERLLRSPDRADALALCFAAPVFLPSDMYQRQTHAKTDHDYMTW